MHATSIDRWASWIHSNLGELRCQILPENMTKRKRWIEAAGQGLFNFWAHIRLWGTRARGRTPLPAAARVASIAFGTNGSGPTKRSFTSLPSSPCEIAGKRKSPRTRRVRTVRPTKILLLSAHGGGRAPPSNRPAARGHAPPPYVTVLPQAAAAHPLRAGTQHRSCMRSFVWSKRPRRHPRSRCVSRARGGPRPSISRPAGGFDPKRAGHGWCVPRRRHPAGWRPARAGADLVATGLCVQIGRGARRLLF